MLLSKKIEKAKLGLMSSKNSAFICHILFNLPLIEDSSVKTAQVNGIDIRYNPTWLDESSWQQIEGLLAHEAWHVAFNHMKRVPQVNLNIKAWRVATDIVINNMLIQAGVQLPIGGIWNRDFLGFSTIQVYNALINSSNPIPDVWEDVVFSTDSSKDEQISDSITQLINTAVHEADTKGQLANIPAEIVKYIKEARNSKLDWNSILSQYLQSFAKVELSYKRTNRRYMDEFTLPSLSKGSVNEICTYLDTSGSVIYDQDVVNTCIAEVTYIKDFVSSEISCLHTFDAKIQGTYDLIGVSSLDDIDLTGGGSTDILPVLEHIKASNRAFSIVITDGYFNSPVQDTSEFYLPNTIWVIYNNPCFTSKFGKIIHIKE